MTDTVSAIRQWAAERRLPEAHLGRWLEMGEADRAALLVAARRLKLRTGAFVTALETLQEIAGREVRSIKAVLGNDKLKRLIFGTGPAPERAHAFLAALRAIRFPRLSAAAERLGAEIAALSLPTGVRVLLPKDLASDELRIELRVRSGAELTRQIEALQRSADKLAHITRLLGGEREL